ncbi:MAG: hypothetical protein QGG88_07575 [Gammaproteobacteria bacterium]|nr:hypothetical protein [Gammaproteobacteria bacterium]
MSQPDIEIYVKGPTKEQIQVWLEQQFDSLHISSQGAQRQAYIANWQGKKFEIMVLLKVQNGYTSIWFNHAPLPWPDDKSCAQQALQQLPPAGLSIRCIASSWQEGDAPDQWLHMDGDGERLMQWPA